MATSLREEYIDILHKHATKSFSGKEKINELMYIENTSNLLTESGVVLKKETKYFDGITSKAAAQAHADHRRSYIFPVFQNITLTVKVPAEETGNKEEGCESESAFLQVGWAVPA